MGWFGKSEVNMNSELSEVVSTFVTATERLRDLVQKCGVRVAEVESEIIELEKERLQVAGTSQRAQTIADNIDNLLAKK